MRIIVLLYTCLELVRLTGNAAPAAAAGMRGERASIDLSGEWEFKLDPTDVGRDEKWFDPGSSFDRQIQVPGAWNAQGFRYESEQHLREYESKRLNTQGVPSSTLGPSREAERIFSVFPGPAWYRKKVTIPDGWKGRVAWLVFEGVHREAEVWINGQPAGAHRSYLTPFRIDLSPYAKAGEALTVAVRVDARRNRALDPLMGCLDTLDFVYVTWGGLHRPVRLEASDAMRLADVFVEPQLSEAVARVRVTIEGPRNGNLAVNAEILEPGGASIASVQESVGNGATEIVLTARIPSAKLWSPKTPHLYVAQVRLVADGRETDVRAVRFGMREFKVAGGKFLLNGKPIFLRGYGDDCIFPNTICPPSDKKEFVRRLSIARAYGFNYVRHHSWTPPEEYLEAADELGMMLQPEFPFAYGWDLPKTPEAKRAALEQWEATIRLNRNHPSIVTWCMGNELYNSFDLAPEMYRAAKRLDPTRPVIDSDGCNFKHQGRETLDFLVVQFGEGNSIGYQDGKYAMPADITKPVIAHEMGYFVTLPDLRQRDLFQGGLRPYWLDHARDLAARNGLTEVYPEWLASSYRLQAASLKCNMEAARRSRLRGTSVWLFQDYPNCAEGVVDMFFQPKGVRPEEFRKYNAPTVLLLDTPRRNYWSGENLEFKFVVSRFEDEPSDAAMLRWELKGEHGTVESGLQERLAIGADGVQELPSIKLKLPARTRAERLTLTAELVDANGKTENAWNLWVFPAGMLSGGAPPVRARGFEAVTNVYPGAIELAAPAVPGPTELLVTTRIDPELRDHLQAGGRVLLLEPEPVFAVEKTNFRLSSWDGGGPSGTVLDSTHPALRAMPSDGWCDLQFYSLIQGSKTVLLDALPTKIQPLVRCIDRPTRLANRAYLFEASVGQGKLLVSSFNFARALASKDPGGVNFFDQLVRYALGSDFNPAASLPEAALKGKTP